MSVLHGFRGWVGGVKKALDTWTDKLSGVPGGIPDTLDHDVAALNTILGDILTTKMESVALENLCGMAGITIPLGYRGNVSDTPEAPVLAEEEETDAGTTLDAAKIAVLVQVAILNSLDPATLGPTQKRDAKSLTRTKHLEPVSPDSEALKLTPKGRKNLVKFARHLVSSL